MTQEMKADGTKIRTDLLFGGCPDALKAVAAVLTYGALKYEPHVWKKVPVERWEAAYTRHMIDRQRGEYRDEESGLLHRAHEAANALFLLQLEIEDYDAEYLTFNQPPQDHKVEEVRKKEDPIMTFSVSKKDVII